MSEAPSSNVKVECYAGYRGEESPRRFTVGGRQVEVVAIEERWREPGCRVVRVRGDDGRLYRLRQAAASGGWEIEPAPTPVRIETRGRVAVAVAEERLPALSAEEVEQTRGALRNRHADPEVPARRQMISRTPPSSSRR